VRNQLRLAPFTAADGRAVTSWRYEGPWSVYDAAGVVMTSADGYAAVRDEDDHLVGYACTGGEARVPGLAARPDRLDVGFGMRPDLVGHGDGAGFIAAVVGLVGESVPDTTIRIVVQEWNTRCRRAAVRAGFDEVDSLDVPEQEQTYVVMERSPGGSRAAH
jgi:ribosomal-protein-alanine N-acetyltransferase